MNNESRNKSFLIGAIVTITALGLKGTVVGIFINPDGDLKIMVDRPHGPGTLRQSFKEEELSQ